MLAISVATLEVGTSDELKIVIVMVDAIYASSAGVFPEQVCQGVRERGVNIYLFTGSALYVGVVSCCGSDTKVLEISCQEWTALVQSKLNSMGFSSLMELYLHHIRLDSIWELKTPIYAGSR